MKGIILAGGNGTRLSPLTRVVSKQLLPVFDKPMVYYPLTTMILAGVDDILLISKPEDQSNFEKLLGDGSEFGISISYTIQEFPGGLAQAPIIGEDFISGEPFMLILGDNFLYGPGLGRSLRVSRPEAGARVFAHKVKNPSAYGVVEFGPDGTVLTLEEKPEFPKSDFAVPGLYFFDSSAVEYCKALQPSARGELEIVDLLKHYLKESHLEVSVLAEGTQWFDMGTFDDLLEAAEFVRAVQSRSTDLIGDPKTARHLLDS